MLANDKSNKKMMKKVNNVVKDQHEVSVISFWLNLIHNPRVEEEI